MPRHYTAEEVREEYIQVMGKEFGNIFCVLSNELRWLYIKWREYVELFGTKPSRVDLLNKAAGPFFRIVHDTLWESVLINITRLTDRPQTASKKNLTIRRLPNLIVEEKIKKDVANLIKTAVEKTEFCRDWRNRHIAHNDLELALKNNVKPLKAANRAKVKEALKAISRVLNAVNIHYINSSILFEGIGSPSSAVSLLYVIDDGLKVEEEQHKRLMAGEYRVGDDEIRDL